MHGMYQHWEKVLEYSGIHQSLCLKLSKTEPDSYLPGVDAVCMLTQQYYVSDDLVYDAVLCCYTPVEQL